MALVRHQYTLVGFSYEVDWRPLKFTEPVPVATICGLCWHVSRTTYSLPCGHILCEPCFRSCAAGAKYECPMDGEECSAEDAFRRDFPADILMRRKVHCWNEANGCSVVLPASEVAQHFHRECQHHSVRCPSCPGTVLWRDMCAHLRSRCATFVLHAVPEIHTRTNDFEEQSVAFERKLEQRVGELNAKLARLSLESGSQSDKMNELCHSINNLNETLKTEFKAAAIRNEDCVGRNAAGIKALCTEKCEALLANVNSLLSRVQTEPKSDTWVLNGYAALKEEALKDGCSWSESDKVYLHRYRISWGIYFRKEGDTVTLCVLFRINKGKNDDLLEWPFHKEVKVSIIHPETGEERQLFPTFEQAGECFNRPIKARNRAKAFTPSEAVASDLEHEGFVKSDQLLLWLELGL